MFSGTMLLYIYQRGVSSIAEPSLFGCNSLTYPLSGGTYYVVISATGNSRLSVGAGYCPHPRHRHRRHSRQRPNRQQTQRGRVATGYNNTKGIDPSVPPPTRLTATVFGVQTSTTADIRLLWQQPRGYAAWQVYESSPPGPFANASACATAGSPGVGFIIVNRHATIGSTSSRKATCRLKHTAPQRRSPSPFPRPQTSMGIREIGWNCGLHHGVSLNRPGSDGDSVVWIQRAGMSSVSWAPFIPPTSIAGL